MISATIQGKYKENRGEHITAQDGKLITGEAQKKCVNAILKDCQNVDISGEYYDKLENSKFFCAIYHPECDDMGRRRIALIVWDKDTLYELIPKTLEVMGLEFERFKRLEREFKRNKIGVSKNALVAIGIIALVASAIYLVTIK